jgi:hypothetical protein
MLVDPPRPAAKAMSRTGVAMCFSATASFTAGVALIGIGAVTLPLVPERRQLWFAALPLVFGVHQMLEGLIWNQIEASGEVAVRTPAVELWLLVAWLLLPIWVPLSVRRFEPDARRRRAMTGLAGLGAVTGGYLAIESMVSATTVQVAHHHLEYAIPVHPGWPIAVPYVAATCLALLLSSHRFVVMFGGALLVAMVSTAILDARSFSSVWCFFAAVLSLMVFGHYARLRVRAQHRQGLTA